MATSQTTQAASTKPSGAVHPIAPARLNPRTSHVEPVALGTWIWLASDLMFFAALFAAYFMIREVTNGQAHGGQSLWSMESTHLDFPKALLNTLVLVLSSVTCQMGVLAAERGRVSRAGSLIRVGGWGMREWYTLTFVMGSIFIGGQVAEFATLISEHHSISSSVYFSAFFLATGFHGLHVTGGLIAFLFVLGRTYLARTFTHEQVVSAIVISYYWHFVDFVWIILFTTLYILK